MVWQLLMYLGPQIPQLVVWVVGAVLAAAFWRRDPRGMLLILLACIISILGMLVFAVIYTAIPIFLQGGVSLGGSRVTLVYHGLGVVRSCQVAVVWVLVLVAVFRRRAAV
jgi:formate hydrogenlyase subunit 3/multisubunit Na+/H+ antiporter MnhD subunit